MPADTQTLDALCLEATVKYRLELCQRKALRVSPIDGYDKLICCVMRLRLENHGATFRYKGPLNAAGGYDCVNASKTIYYAEWLNHAMFDPDADPFVNSLAILGGSETLCDAYLRIYDDTAKYV